MKNTNTNDTCINIMIIVHILRKSKIRTTLSITEI